MKRLLITLFLGGVLLTLAAPEGIAQRRRGPLRGGIPIESDVQIGMETVNQINADPATYPVLDEAEYPEAYELIQGIVNRILVSPAIEHKDIFRYQDVKIIHDDETLNAFCTAGGFIYVYTGLIKYLDREDHLAGVLGHEIAHAEERHVADQLEKKGRRRLLKLAAVLAVDSGSGEVAAVLAGTKLLGLKYGRTQETEADARSVAYLADAEDYACNGAAGFFEKLEKEGEGGQPPHWLSDHPDGAKRVKEINKQSDRLQCSTQSVENGTYARLKAALP